MLNRNAERSAKIMEKFKEEFGADAKVSLVTMDLAVLASVREARIMRTFVSWWLFFCCCS